MGSAEDRGERGAGTEPSQAATGDPARGAQLATADEGDRAIRELADLVLQRLFGLGATLMALSSAADDVTAERLRGCIDDLDQTIDALRDGILHQMPVTPCARPGLGPVPAAAVIALGEAVVAANGAPPELPESSARRSTPSVTGKKGPKSRPG